MASVFGVLMAVAAVSHAASAQDGEVVAEVRVHGNRLTPTEQVLALASLEAGTPFSDALIVDTRARLLDSGRFDDVQVLKRFASISDPARILVIIIVDEHPASIRPSQEPGGPAQVTGRRGPDNLMLLPILWIEDGYGITFGVRLALVNAGTKKGRISFPLSWGGERKAGAEYEVTLERGLLSRVQVGAALVQRENPAFEIADRRARAHVRAERAIGPVAFGAHGEWEDVSFGETADRMISVGADVVLDTRADPYLARNAVYVRAGWTRLSVESGAQADRTELDARGYVRLLGQSIAVARWQHVGTDAPLAPFLKPLLGGWSTLRGFPAGWRAGDALVAASLEIRVPLTDALSLAKLGTSVFADAGTVADHGDWLRDQPIDYGVGASVWLTAAAFRVGVSIARGVGYGTRVNFGGGLSF
jgi:outer membrane protein assembly factor BamA